MHGKESAPTAPHQVAVEQEVSLALLPSFGKFYGITLCIHQGTLSYCALESDSGNTPSVVEEGRVLERVSVEAYRQSLISINNIIQAQLKSENLLANDYSIPILVSLDTDETTLEEILSPYFVEGKEEEIRSDLDRFAYELIFSMAVGSGMAPENIHFLGARFSKGTAPSKNVAIDPRGRSSLSKILKFGERAHAGDRFALERLKSIAVKETRRELKNEIRLGEYATLKRDAEGYFKLYMFKECNYLDHPEVKEAVAKEYRRMGFDGELTFSYPHTPKQPYYSSLLAQAMKANMRAAIESHSSSRPCLDSDSLSES